MAIMYVFTTNNPNPGTVSDFPPSVQNSEWFANLHEFLNVNAVGGPEGQIVIIFPNQAALETYVSTYKLTDPALISDLNAWKSAHGISFSTSYYTLTEATITPTPDPVFS